MSFVYTTSIWPSNYHAKFSSIFGKNQIYQIQFKFCIMLTWINFYEPGHFPLMVTMSLEFCFIIIHTFSFSKKNFSFPPVPCQGTLKNKNRIQRKIIQIHCKASLFKMLTIRLCVNFWQVCRHLPLHVVAFL